MHIENEEQALLVLFGTLGFSGVMCISGLFLAYQMNTGGAASVVPEPTHLKPTQILRPSTTRPTVIRTPARTPSVTADFSEDCGLKCQNVCLN
jgi:hypothetical protein